MICVSNSYLIKSYSDINFVSVQIMTSPPITICWTYIPPSYQPHLFSMALDAIESISQSHPRLIVVGDFNAPDINWDCLPPLKNPLSYVT